MKRRASAVATVDPAEGSFAIASSLLTLEAEVPGPDDATFQELAGKAKKSCPVSKPTARLPSRWTQTSSDFGFFDFCRLTVPALRLLGCLPADIWPEDHILPRPFSAPEGAPFVSRDDAFNGTEMPLICARHAHLGA
jgi:hypothetical protein